MRRAWQQSRKRGHNGGHTRLLRRTTMTGIRVFSSVEDAQAAGFTIFERIPEGYLVRKDSGANFMLAVVKIKKEEPTEKD